MASESIEKNKRLGDYYDDVRSAVRELRRLRQRDLDPHRRKTPTEYNIASGKFNRNARVRMLQDKVRAYKNRVRTGRDRGDDD